ncbi:MAG: EAL domain-containing protein [Methyloprofundus sp.]|nr:EAL domain-containing protein [Methyloprofundus sp.]
MEKSKLSVDDLQNALDKSEFVFYYQPLVSLISGKLIGAEALIRWHTSDGKIIHPNDFIPFAEESRFITKITCHMFDKFVEDVSLIQDVDETLIISINFSAHDIDDDVLLNKISYAVNHGLIDRHRFAVELTETAVSQHLQSAKSYYSYFRNMNIPLIMDDFGTGFANLSSLINTPFTKIKLDHSVIKDFSTNEKKASLLKNIFAWLIGLAWTLWRKVLRMKIHIKPYRIWVALQRRVILSLPRYPYLNFLRSSLFQPPCGQAHR